MPTKLRKLSRWLRRHYPIRRKVRIILRTQAQMPGLHGEMEMSGNRVTIRLVQASDPVMLETLIEEYCHAVRHECPVPVEQEHDQLFWAIYGAVTMAYRGGE